MNFTELVRPGTLGLGFSQYWERKINPDLIKKLLESPNEAQIIEGLSLLIAAMSKGTNCQHLFPNIAILIAKKNLEIKKMIYICIGHYAELEQTTALLAINILEKDLAHPHQVIRAHALRTISNIRVKMIIQLLISAVIGGTKDTSAYVRRTATHSILKIWSLDNTTKESFLEPLERLLLDVDYSVLGSAAAVFNEMCPDEYQIINKCFHRLIRSVLDCDEWAQQHLLSLLTRYARTQFVNPNIETTKEKKDDEKEDNEKKEIDEDEEKEEDDEFANGFEKIEKLEPDHRLLLDTCLPLLKSNSCGVVMQVVSLFHYCAPKNEMSKVISPLIKFLRTSREVQYCILDYIQTLSIEDPSLFQPHILEFFINSPSESSFIKLQKLTILSLIASEINIDIILKEFKFYTMQDDEEFVANTIHAIGNCAIRIPEILNQCLTLLMQLLSSKNDTVVAESIVVLKQILQMPREEGISYDAVIKQLTRLFSKVTSPKAKASIIWVVGEYVEVVKDYAPDILRLLAKEFTESTDDVKMQIINLGAKLLLTNPDKTRDLVHYVFFLAKFDTNYDIRDKARVLRFLLFPNKEQEQPNILQKQAAKFILSPKPSPRITDNVSNKLLLGSLSHLVQYVAPGYNSIPDWQIEPADASLRKPPVVTVPMSPVNVVNPSTIPNISPVKLVVGEAFYEEDEYYEEEYYEDGEEYEEEEYYEEDEYYEEEEENTAGK